MGGVKVIQGNDKKGNEMNFVHEEKIFRPGGLEDCSLLRHKLGSSLFLGCTSSNSEYFQNFLLSAYS